MNQLLSHVMMGASDDGGIPMIVPKTGTESGPDFLDEESSSFNHEVLGSPLFGDFFVILLSEKYGGILASSMTIF